MRILPILLLLSGFAGISYEVLYGRILGNLLGDQFAVSSAVLITFLAGSAIGAWMSRRLRNFLWAVEGGIGLFAALISVCYDRIDAALYSGVISISGLAGQVGLGVLLFALPAFLIGASVPIFASIFESQESRPALFSRVYSVYNFGAALTALLLEFVIIRLTGIRGALLVFAGLNGCIALCLWVKFRKPDAAHSEIRNSKPPGPPASLPRSLLWALITASIASAIFQLFMVKVSEFLFGPFRETFALVLALVLLGIALGSRLVRTLDLSFHQLSATCVIAVGFLLVGFDPMTTLYAFLYPDAGATHAGALLLKAAALIVLMLLPAVGFGATVPALIRTNTNVGPFSGRLLAVSSAANAAGFLLMVFVVHPNLEYGWQLLFIGTLALLAWLLAGPVNAKRLAAAGLSAPLLIGAHFLFWDESLLYVSYNRFKSPQTLEKARANLKIVDGYRDKHDVFSITTINGDPYFFINGYISFPLNSASEKIVGLLSVQFSPRLDNALVLGLGSGSTASVVGLAFDHTDAVEINPAVRANIGRMKKWNYDIEHNERVNMIVDDAIHYVRTSNKSYSLILNTVTSPLYFSSSKLYTMDFLRWAKSRLRSDGIYATWIDSRAGDKGIQIMLRTLRDCFPACSMFYIKSGYFLILCSPSSVSLTHKNLKPRLPQIYRELARSGILGDAVPYQAMGNVKDFIEEGGNVSANRLDFPVLEFEMAGLPRSGFGTFKERASEHISLQSTLPLLGAIAPLDPVDFAVHARRRLGRSEFTSRWLWLAEQSGPGWSERLHASERRYLDEVREAAASH